MKPLEDNDSKNRVTPWLEVINRYYLCFFPSLHQPSCSIFTPLHHPSKPSSSRLRPLSRHPLCERTPPLPLSNPSSLPSVLISRIYCALVHSSQPVTHALWVDPGRIQFVRYYVLIPALSPLPPPLCSAVLAGTHWPTCTIPWIILITQVWQFEPVLGLVAFSPLAGTWRYATSAAWDLFTKHLKACCKVEVSFWWRWKKYKPKSVVTALSMLKRPLLWTFVSVKCLVELALFF